MYILGHVLIQRYLFYSFTVLAQPNILQCGWRLLHRYSILAPNAIPEGFVDGKVVTGKILEALQMDENEYRLGITKVFFKAGVLGMLEDMRDERLGKIISMFQAQIRGYIMRRNYKKLQDQR